MSGCGTDSAPARISYWMKVSLISLMWILLGSSPRTLCRQDIRYTGHCPLLRFSMGQTYGQVTGQLLRGSPGLAWPPAHRTLLPPIQSPRSPVISRERLPPRRGHERLSSSIIPGYTGFIPQAQFIFAKNRNQVWAEAMDDFTQRHGPQESHELSEEAEERKEEEEGQGPEAEEPELKQEVAQASLATCPVPASSSAPASPCSPTRHCRNLGRHAHGAGCRRIPNLPPHSPGPTSRTWVSSLTMEATCQGISSSLAGHLGISPMKLWVSAPLRNSSWLKYLDLKFSLFILSQ
ncbi:protein FAM166B isoform X4 [Peromyscus californicus insignis]|uniref:protein FAM166B isoform X4 n=1 Tax=Peromyscus californicus insignis TaxID=564181 RepID=UPI0022A69485|nr:protein FAM166B isoform X4 [Peromyscus californicus insignis]